MAEKQPSPPVVITDTHPRIKITGIDPFSDAQGWMDSGLWVEGDSSNVKGLSYDKKQQSLYVEFKSHAVYVYYNVPEQVAKDFFNASSLGVYLHQRIKTKGYLYKQLVKGVSQGKGRRKKKS